MDPKPGTSNKKKKVSGVKHPFHAPKYIALSDKQLELLSYGYIRQQLHTMGVNRLFPAELFQFVHELNGLNETFNRSNYTLTQTEGSKGLIFSENNCTIYQADSTTRSVLGTLRVEKGHSFYWEFLITEWSGYCCRIGIIDPETRANGTIWETPGAVLMCFQPECWKCAWTNATCINYAPYRDDFSNGDTFGIQLTWPKETLRGNVSFYHNRQPLQKAQTIETELDAVSVFAELCGECKIEILEARYLH